MCEVGDIIIVNKYKGDDNSELSKHTFIIVDDNGGEIYGLPFDLVANVMSSIKDDNHKNKKLRHEENMLFRPSDYAKVCSAHNQKEAFVKADQLFYFRKAEISYIIFGKATQEILEELFNLLNILDEKDKIKINVNNL